MLIFCSLQHEWATHGTCFRSVDFTDHTRVRQLTYFFSQYSTLNPNCLPSDSPTGAEVCSKALPNMRCGMSDPFGKAVAFFQTAVRLFQVSIYLGYSSLSIHPIPEILSQTLPTYTFLSNAGIEPSPKEQHTLDEFISALENGSGVSKLI